MRFRGQGLNQTASAKPGVIQRRALTSLDCSIKSTRTNLHGRHNRPIGLLETARVHSKAVDVVQSQDNAA